MSDADNGVRRSKIISREELAGYQSWQPPTMTGGVASAHVGGKNAGMLTAKQIERIQQQAYEEGFALGRREGVTAAKSQLDAIVNALSAPLVDFDAAMTDELVSLVTAVARQLIRRELKTSPGEIVAVVREALAALPSGAREIRIHLHPDDAILVREALNVGDIERHWKIADDPAQFRGGCRVFNDASHIDASVETRIATVIAHMLCGEREEDARS